MAEKQTAHPFEPNEVAPSLREALQTGGLDGTKLMVGLPTKEQSGGLASFDRHRILLNEGEKIAEWHVSSLRELWRGDKKPPADMSHYPKEYVPMFFFIERQARLADEMGGGLRDLQFEEIYSMLRRRPDGKSLGPVHDYLWQVAATLLGMRVLSQAEFEEIFGQLARSCRRWAMGATSRNYMDYLKEHMG